MKFFFHPDFDVIWLKSFKKVHSQLCSILQGLGQPSSHMCTRHFIRLWTILVFLSFVYNELIHKTQSIFYPKIVFSLTKKNQNMTIIETKTWILVLGDEILPNYLTKKHYHSFRFFSSYLWTLWVFKSTSVQPDIGYHQF